MESLAFMLIYIIFPLVLVGLYICHKTNLVDLIKGKKEDQRRRDERERTERR